MSSSSALLSALQLAEKNRRSNSTATRASRCTQSGPAECRIMSENRKKEHILEVDRTPNVETQTRSPCDVCRCFLLVLFIYVIGFGVVWGGR